MFICTYVLIILHIQLFIFIICHIYLPSILTPHQSTVSGPEFFKSGKLWLVSPDLGFVAGQQLEMFGAHNTNIRKIAILNDAKWRIYFDSIIYIYIILLNMIFGFCSLNLLGTPPNPWLILIVPVKIWHTWWGINPWFARSRWHRMILLHNWTNHMLFS